MKKYNPWSIALIVHLALLAGVNYWRESTGYSEFAMIKGSSPNFLAVPILCFGAFLFIYFDKRERRSPSTLNKLKKVFIVSLASSVIINLIWEFMQLKGQLVFDIMDIGFVALGLCYTIILFIVLRPLHFMGEPGAGGEAVR